MHMVTYGFFNCANEAKKILKVDVSKTSNQQITFCETWVPCVQSLSR